MAMCAQLYTENPLPPKELALLLIAFDSHNVHATGHFTRHHIKNAFGAGATACEIMEVLKVGVVPGVRCCNVWPKNANATPPVGTRRHKQRAEV